MRPHRLRTAILAALGVTLCARASTFDDFDGNRNSDGVKYIERYTPPGQVPRAPHSPDGSGAYDEPSTGMMTGTGLVASDSSGEKAAAWRRQVLAGFKAAYKRAGSPRIAVFWNRELTDQLSQWYADKRVIHTGEQAGQGKDRLQPAGATAAPGYQRDTSVANHTTEAQYFADCKAALSLRGADGSRLREYTPELCYQILQRPMPAGDGMGGRAKEFEFGSGFMGPFLGASAKMLDRAAIMRITQRDSARRSGVEVVSDAVEVETDALVGHADYVAEIVYSANPGSQLGVEFLVTVKQVKSGRVVAMFRPAATPADLPPPSTRWAATAAGFEKRTTHASATPHQVGAQLAFETMEALSRAW